MHEALPDTEVRPAEAHCEFEGPGRAALVDDAIDVYVAKVAQLEQAVRDTVASFNLKPLADSDLDITLKIDVTTVDRDTLPKGVVETHVSLFDGTNAGLALEGRPVFSVQHHPEASPGPTDSLYLFDRFAKLMDAKKV